MSHPPPRRRRTPAPLPRGHLGRFALLIALGEALRAVQKLHRSCTETTVNIKKPK